MCAELLHRHNRYVHQSDHEGSIMSTLTSQLILDIWPQTAPGKITDSKEEHILGERNVTRTHHVSVPQLTVFHAAPREDGKPVPAVMVMPGGGYSILAYDLEGTETAAWLNSIGFTAILLKYRVPDNREGALMDAQRSMGLIRAHASEWNIDPNRLGVIGFSAGAHLSAMVSTNYATRTYDRIDATDDLSCKPDFTMLVYPAYLNAEDGSLKAELPVNEQTPPCIIVQTQDDHLTIDGALAYYKALVKNKVMTELHLYPYGGHGYGLRPGANPVSTEWPVLFGMWLQTHFEM
jgi:acetyl esterase/lipase